MRSFRVAGPIRTQAPIIPAVLSAQSYKNMRTVT